MAAGYAPLVGHHRHLLDDGVRTRALLKAIAGVVKPGDVVADLGTGTGVLAIAARRAGASKVWAIDHDPIVKVAEAIARDNGVDGITFVQQHSREVVLPEPVDVIVSECFGPLAVGGSMIPALIDARRRWLKPGGRMVPRSVSIFVAPVETKAAYAYVSGFAKQRYGLAWHAAHELATQNVYNTEFAASELLARASAGSAIELERHDLAEVRADGVWHAARAGTVHGFAGWFEADLGGGVVLTTAPGKPSTIWRQVFFPLREPVRVKRGTQIVLSMRSIGGEHWDWSGDIAGTRFACSTRYSYPEALTPSAGRGATAASSE